MIGKDVDRALEALARAAAEKAAGKAVWMPVFADVFLGGERIGHIVSDGYEDRMWTFHPVADNRRKRHGSITSCMPQWTHGATLGDFKTHSELVAEREAGKPKPVDVSDWAPFIRKHRDFIRAGRSDHGELGIVLRDGWGYLNFFGEDAWEQAAAALGFNTEDS